MGVPRPVIAGLIALALAASLLRAAEPVQAAEGALCENRDRSRVDSPYPIPVAVCYDAERDEVTIANNVSYWVKVRLPDRRGRIETDFSRSPPSHKLLGNAGTLPLDHLPPKGRMTVEIKPVGTDKLRFGVQGIKSYTFASTVTSLIGVNAFEEADSVVAFSEEVRRAAEELDNCGWAWGCTSSFHWDVNFAAARYVGPKALKLPVGSLRTLLDYSAQSAIYWGQYFGVVPPAPDDSDNSGDGTSGGGGEASTPSLPIPPDACSPPVPSGHRGVADTTHLPADPCSGVLVRDGTTLSDTVLTSIPQGTVFDITCQVRGATITDGQGSASDVWNRVSIDGVAGFVQDTWSGGKGWLSIPCNEDATAPIGGCGPAVPSGARGVADTTEWDPDPCSGVFLRSGPGNHNTVSREIPQGTVFDIDCQVRGQSVTDSRGSSSDVWNKTSYDGISGFVSDVWSGQKGWLGQPCGEPTGCDPEIPSGHRGVADTTRFPDDPCSGAYLRNGTTLDDGVLREVQQGRIFDIHCQRRGETITDGTGYQSNVWNKTSVDGTTGWVQDTWSGRKGWLELSCDATPPDAPARPTANPRDAGAEIEWSAPDDNGGKILSYEIRVSEVDGDVVRTVTEEGPSAVIENLNNGTEFEFAVRAINHKGPGRWSRASEAVTPAGLPWDAGAPSASLFDGGVELSWVWAAPANNGSSLSGFDVELRDLDAETIEQQSVEPETGSLTWQNVEDGHEYQARVRGHNDLGKGEWSDWSAPVSPPAKPGPVEELEVTETQDGADVSWSDPSATEGPDVDGYDVVTLSGRTVQQTTSTEVTLQDLEADEVEVAVRAFTEDANGAPRSEALPLAFSDVNADHAHAAGIRWSAGQEVTVGFPDGTYRPGARVTRGQMATFLVRALDLPEAEPADFDDVSSEHTHGPAIASLAAADVTSGYADGTFRPAAPVTRAQMASFLDRALDLPASAEPAEFTDVPDDSVHAEAIDRLVNAEITLGFPDGTYRPGGDVTRGQMASFLHRGLVDQ